MYVEIEPRGCTERKGLVQVRFAMYLDPGDYEYDVHHVLVPVILESKYSGRLDEQGTPVDGDAYRLWLDALPKAWQTNPFHNHFIYVKPETPDDDIVDTGEAFLHEAYTKWANDETLNLKNPPIAFPSIFDRAKVEAKVEHLKNTKLERKV